MTSSSALFKVSRPRADDLAQPLVEAEESVIHTYQDPNFVGTCELETKHGVINLHVNQITSVEYVRDPDSRADYSISYPGGTVPVTKGMRDFADFLNRLRALNPAVDLTSFPPDTWPNLGGPQIRRPLSVNCLFRTAFFPLLVVSLLVWMASQTLLGK